MKRFNRMGYFRVIAIWILLDLVECDDSIFDSSALVDKNPKDFGDNYVLNTLKLYPGTKWCGESSDAENYDDLGEHTETDRCCRDRANCESLISPGETKFGLKNEHPFGVVECSCGEKMVACMNAVNTKASKDVQYIFFGVQHPPCFKFKGESMKEAKWSTPVRDPTLAKEIDGGTYSFTPPSTWDKDDD